MPYYTSNGKVYLQDANSVVPNAAYEVSTAPAGATTPLPAGITTFGLGSSFTDAKGEAYENIAGKGLVRKMPRYNDVVGAAAPSGFVSSEEAKLYEAGGIYGDRSAPNAATIREKIAKDAQLNIDAINMAADRLVKQENEVNAPDRLGRARSIASRSGLLGSTFYEAGTKPNVEKKNADAMAAIEEDRQIKLAGVFTAIDAITRAEYNAKVAQAQGSANAYVNFLKTSQEAAREQIKNMAGLGVSWDVLSSDPNYSDTLKNLMKYGDFRDTNELEAYFNANKPDDQKIKYTTETIKGDNGNAWILRYGLDPVTGKVTTQKGDTGIAYDTLKAQGKSIQEANGIFYQYDPNAGTLTKIGGTATTTPGGNLTEDQKNYSTYAAQEKAAGRTPMPFGDWVGKTGDTTTPLSKAQLNSFTTAGVPETVSKGIHADMAQGWSLEEIRQNLSKQFGKETGYGYLDRFMTTAQKDNSLQALLGALNSGQ